MNILQAIILGIVQGITEFLPVSSSGHLVIFPNLFGWNEQSLGFDIVVHAATLLAIVIFYRARLINIARGLISKDAKSRQSSGKLILMLLITTIPVFLFYLLFKDFISTYFRSLEVIALTLSIVGILLIKSDTLFKNNFETIANLSPGKAFVIGVFQSLALIRGVSRSGITIIGSALTGYTRKDAVDIAFLAGIPSIGASFLMLLLDLGSEPIPESIPVLIVGFLAAFISGYLAISFLVNYVKTKGLAVFGYYRLALAAVILILFVL